MVRGRAHRGKDRVPVLFSRGHRASRRVVPRAGSASATVTGASRMRFAEVARCADPQPVALNFGGGFGALIPAANS